MMYHPPRGHGKAVLGQKARPMPRAGTFNEAVEPS